MAEYEYWSSHEHDRLAVENSIKVRQLGAKSGQYTLFKIMYTKSGPTMFWRKLKENELQD